MYHVLLIVCALGTPPSPQNPTCQALLFSDEAHETREACWERAGVMVTLADPVLRTRGLEAWRHERISCMTDEERQAPRGARHAA